jgi:hypothetical protein
MAGALGIEPRPSVLETDVLTVEHHAPVRLALNMSPCRFVNFSLQPFSTPSQSAFGDIHPFLRKGIGHASGLRIAATDFSDVPPALRALYAITSFPYAGYACDSTDSTSGAPNDPDHSSCSSCSSNCGACIQNRPM